MPGMSTSSTSPAPVTWFEIATDDPDTARRFYGELFGWTFATEDPAYPMITIVPGQPPQGGIRDTSAPQPDGVPRSYAVPYVQVADVAATCGQLERLGGKVTVGATDADGLVYALVTDPSGSLFGLFTPPAA
jgi:predicted enzyme related to lactoylglutathione lyase